MSTEKAKRGLLDGWFNSSFWDSKIKSANVTSKELWLGYVFGPFGVMLLQSIVNSYFNKYLTDTLGFTVTRGMWIAGFMVVFPVLSKLFDAITNVIMAKVLDRTVCRQGKLRPWMILSLPITVASIIMMFAIPDMSAKAQAVWVVISYNLFYSIGYTMWYMAYELSAALSTRNVKQRSGNSMAGQITKNIGTGIISILFPTILERIAAGVTHGDMKQGYLVTLAVMCVIAVPLTFIQYFYTRERITEERRSTEVAEEGEHVAEANFITQLKACLKDKYWIMFIILIFVYQVLNALKSVSQIYYAGWVVNGNAYGEAAAIQARFTMIAMAPMGPMLFIVVPLIKKYGRSKMIIIGSIVAFIGAAIAFFGAGNTAPVYAGTGLGGVGAMFYVYTMMSFTGDAIDHVEYSQSVRVEGITAALVGFMHSLANGLGQGLFNLGLMLTKYVTPELVGTTEKKGKLIELYADQSRGATTWINFSYQGAIALTALLFLILFLFFFDIDKRMPTVTEELTNRKKAECEAKGIPYISPQEQQRAEIAKQQAEAEENRIKELKEACAKKGLDFETENQKYLDKKAKKDAKKAARKAKRK
ncbi:MAG: MFS transporter [Lachnospiraceae bacterium]|nr:MFS transporter [Lachnospiraceae bacterium]